MLGVSLSAKKLENASKRATAACRSSDVASRHLLCGIVAVGSSTTAPDVGRPRRRREDLDLSLRVNGAESGLFGEQSDRF